MAHEGHGAGWHFSRLLNGLFAGIADMAENGPSKKRPIKRSMKSGFSCIALGALDYRDCRS